MRHDKDLTPDQQDAIDHLYEYDASLLVGGMGAGKTIVAATGAVERLRNNITNKVLITAPLMPCETAWVKVFEEWSHLKGYRVSYCLGDANRRAAAMIEDADFMVINHENLPWLAKTYGKEHGFDGIIIDELSKFRRGGATQYKAFRKLGIKGWRVGLTGTPVSEDWLGFYGMTKVLDGGLRFGTRLDKYREKYFIPADYNQHNWIAKPGSKQAIVKKLRGLAHVMPDYTSTLPALTIAPVHVRLTEESMRVYKTLENDMVVMLEGVTFEAVNAGVLSSKLRQAAGGFLYGEGTHHRFGMEKIDAATRIIDRADSPIIVVYEYIEEITWLKSCYPDAPVLGDGLSRKRKMQAVEDFAQGNVPVLFMHPAAAGHGTDGLQAFCHTMLFLCPIWSQDKYSQVIARIWRRGQTEPCKVSVLLAMGTIDETNVMPKLADKADNMPEFLRLWDEQS